MGDLLVSGERGERETERGGRGDREIEKEKEMWWLIMKNVVADYEDVVADYEDVVADY